MRLLNKILRQINSDQELEMLKRWNDEKKYLIRRKLNEIDIFYCLKLETVKDK